MFSRENEVRNAQLQKRKERSKEIKSINWKRNGRRNVKTVLRFFAFKPFKLPIYIHIHLK